MNKSKLIVKTKVDEEKGIFLKKMSIKGEPRDVIVATIESFVEMFYEGGMTKKEMVDMVKETYDMIKEDKENGK